MYMSLRKGWLLLGFQSFCCLHFLKNNPLKIINMSNKHILGWQNLMPYKTYFYLFYLSLSHHFAMQQLYYAALKEVMMLFQRWFCNLVILLFQRKVESETNCFKHIDTSGEVYCIWLCGTCFSFNNFRCNKKCNVLSTKD